MRMRPMSLAEAGYSTGDISLKDLLDGAEPSAGDPGI